MDNVEEMLKTAQEAIEKTKALQTALVLATASVGPALRWLDTTWAEIEEKYHP